jgi:hypothetical protein
MKILSLTFHRAIEHYWTGLFLKEHVFYFLGANNLSEMMFLRPSNPNSFLVDSAPKGITLAVAHTPAQWETLSHYGVPVLYWEHHLPYEKKPEGFSPQIVVYLSSEAERLWGLGEYRFVAHHPIDITRFSGWQGADARALMVATMPMKWWGDKKGTSLFHKMIEAKIPYKLVGHDNETDWPMCEPEFVTSEKRMAEIYRALRVYGCTSPQIERAPLEALATGMPLVMRKHEFNTLVKEVGPITHFCESDEEFHDALMAHLSHTPGIKEYALAERRREVIHAHFAPQKVHDVWEEAFVQCQRL